MLNVVLVEPEIPNNTGNIGRLCLGTQSNLHLIQPYGFEINDKQLRRAGLDYWQHLNVFEYPNFDSFLKQHPASNFHFFSKKATSTIWETTFSENDFLIFGKESVGLSDEILHQFPNQQVAIPVFSEKVRSYNIANAVAISIFEGLRQTKSLD